MDRDDLLDYLHARGLIRAREATVTPLTGGVSSEILLIDDGEKRFVLKRALPKLKVKDDWFADVSRNKYEQEYLKYVGAFLPNAVPKVLHSDPEQGFFIMEYLGEGYANWKKLLLEGQAEIQHAEQAGRILGTVHRRSWDSEYARKCFDTSKNFYQLRVEPYLVTTGNRHPALSSLFAAEAHRLAETQLCLVHGDFSPKNILIGTGGRMVLLDCEVAWFGDPAFDVAFLLNHFFLKSVRSGSLGNPLPTPEFWEFAEAQPMMQQLIADIMMPFFSLEIHAGLPRQFIAMAIAAWNSYIQQLDPHQRDGLEKRVCRLLLMLMLARIDGKSPVEYLTDERKRNWVRLFVSELLPRSPDTLHDISEQFIRAEWVPAAQKSRVTRMFREMSEGRFPTS